MKAEHINPFLQETVRIFNQVAGINLMRKGTTVKVAPVASKNVMIIVGVTGALKGSVAINMDIEFAKKIASNMMCGFPVEVFDDMPKSAVSELANMTMGSVATAFANEGILIDITPPSLLTGKDIELSSKLPMISVQFTCENYDLDFDISIA